MYLWTINGRFAGQPVTGVQRYAAGIVCAIDRRLSIADGGHDEIAIEIAIPRGTELPFALKQISVRTVDGGNGHGWEQVAMPRAARGGLLSLANTGPILHRRQIVCVHDANTRTCPESYSRSFRAFYRGLHPLLGRTAVAIATVSQFSAREIVHHGIADRSKIFVAPNGHEHALAWTPQHTPATRAVSGPGTIVVLGSPAPHKNIRMLLGLAPKLAAHGLSLAIAGVSNGNVFAHPTVSDADGASAASNVHWLGRIGDNALAALMADSLCLAFPSLTEGFGLPPLEAMARGCPVVVSDRASLPEICGTAALIAPPDAPAMWLAHFLALRADPGLRARHSALGLVQARMFSWDQSATKYLAEMRRHSARFV